jgi:hypothetical protein
MLRMDLPVRVVSEANLREHWAAKARRAAGQRRGTRMALGGVRAPEVGAGGVRVVLTRLGGARSRRMDGDNGG